MINEFAKYIEHTLLKPYAVKNDIEKLCREAVEYGFATVCVNPCNILLAKEKLADSDVGICTVIGFPLGANTSGIKAKETEDALKMGADEFDMVINIGALKDKRYDAVLEDIKEVVMAAGGKTVKAIIETGLLTDDEKVAASKIASGAGVHFVKTCTGFAQGIAEVKDIIIIKNAIPPDVRIKASGGIRDYKTAKALIDAGAVRIGTSSGVLIMSEKLGVEE